VKGGRKRFFFEKKKQKTFILGGVDLGALDLGALGYSGHLKGMGGGASWFVF
jgi:hypothetical protein